MTQKGLWISLEKRCCGTEEEEGEIIREYKA